MLKPKLTLPPFAALRAFHAAAIHDRFKDAAESLGLTESAISHQIRRLEEFLHASLIDRSGPRPTLSELGERYLAQIEPALRQIHAATDAILPASGRRAVRLTLPSSFAAMWLVPKLGVFEEIEPDIDLQLIMTTRVVDLQREQVDLAIRHGKGPWPDVDSQFLLEETAMPVCAPGYLKDDRDMSSSLPRQARFLVNRQIPDEWTEWAKARGIKPPVSEQLMVLDSMEQALQIAETGHGLAMGRRPVVDRWLERDRLVTPFGGAKPTGAAYHLCRPIDTTLGAAARRLEAWLMREAGQAS